MTRDPQAAMAVAVIAPVDGLLDYLLPVDTPLGAWVLVPLGRQQVLGVVWAPASGDYPLAKLRPALRVLELPPLSAAFRRYLMRASDYTLTPLGQMLRLVSRCPGLADPPATQWVVNRSGPDPARPTPARRRVLEALDTGALLTITQLAQQAGVSPGVVQGLISAGTLTLQPRPRDAAFARPDPDFAPRPLSAGQAEAAAAITASLDQGFTAFLVEGVTGSGKTEVYLEAMAACLRRGQQVLVLLPEIALTSAFIARVTARFGAAPAEWHSGLGAADRRRAWRAIASGEARVVVGARSALFLPFPDLGLITIDEEHDASYKQEEGVLYHARDMAVLRAASMGCTVVLASATPSLESWANARAGRYRHLRLTERFGPAVLPRLEAIDLRQTPPERGEWLSPPLLQAMRETLAMGEQVLLFLNRRGYAPLTLCRKCGHRLGCPQCSSWLVEHRSRHRHECHQCGFGMPSPRACPECQTVGQLAACGPGIERLAEEVTAKFPAQRVAILSSDHASTPADLRALLDNIAAGGADIIIGTQLAAKGHNFPLLTLVGIIDGDLGLQGGDLRAAERSWQLVRQVSGRAGRAEKPGRALVQTVAPDHPVMQALVRDSDGQDGFLQAELAARQAAHAPPFARYVAIIIAGEREEQVWATARSLTTLAEPLEALGAELWGPTPAPLFRLRGRVRLRFLIRADRQAPLQATIRDWLVGWRRNTKLPANVRVVWDVDPISFL